MSLAAELVCSGFARSLRFYTDVLGFTTMRYLPEQRRAELERDGVAIEIIERASASVAPLEYPFGRGLTLVVWTHDVDAVYSGVQAYGARLHVPLAEVFTEEEGVRTGHLAFEVLDPDGYTMRFCQALPPPRAR
jgi:catechol 2,3-dioxygenase-like lactoylglutathione lyase family enzyme